MTLSLLQVLPKAFLEVKVIIYGFKEILDRITRYEYKQYIWVFYILNFVLYRLALNSIYVLRWRRGTKNEVIFIEASLPKGMSEYCDSNRHSNSPLFFFFSGCVHVECFDHA